jgi:hypothetical protein
MLLPWLWLRFRSRFWFTCKQALSIYPVLEIFRSQVGMAECRFDVLVSHDLLNAQIDPNSQARHSKALASTQRDARAYKFGR